jgi:hypothetical protein
MLVRGAEPMENASNAAFYGLALLPLLTCLLRYPLILWITVYRL